jgi:hypothetical protein
LLLHRKPWFIYVYCLNSNKIIANKEEQDWHQYEYDLIDIWILIRFICYVTSIVCDFTIVKDLKKTLIIIIYKDNKRTFLSNNVVWSHIKSPCGQWTQHKNIFLFPCYIEPFFKKNKWWNVFSPLALDGRKVM